MVVFGLSALLTVRRSNSVYRSFSALAALLRFLHSLGYSDVYRSFAADGCIFKLETLARSLGDSCAEKEYLLALVDLGRAAYITSAWSEERYDGTVMKAELFDAISLQQQYVPSPPAQTQLILFLQNAQRRLYCFCWQSVHRLCKSIHFFPLVPSLSFPLHR